MGLRVNEPDCPSLLIEQRADYRRADVGAQQPAGAAETVSTAGERHQANHSKWLLVPVQKPDDRRSQGDTSETRPSFRHVGGLSKHL